MNEPCFVLDRHAEPDFNVLAHESNSPQEDMPLYPDTLFWLWTNQSLLLLLNAACLAQKQQIQIFMSLVWPSRGSNPPPSTLEGSTLTVGDMYEYSIFLSQFYEGSDTRIIYFARFLTSNGTWKNSGFSFNKRHAVELFRVLRQLIWGMQNLVLSEFLYYFQKINMFCCDHVNVK